MDRQSFQIILMKVLLLERISLPHDDEEIMPPKGSPLNSEEIALFEEVGRNGAQWPEELILVHESL